MPDWLVLSFAFIFGAAVGSFVNVCIYRLPRRLSILKPPSHCPYCGMTLAAIDLVPLLSFLWLMGKCRHCKTPISWRYFLVELATALLFVAAVKVYGVRPEAVLVGAALAGLLVIAVVDWQFFLVPDEAVWALGLFGVGRQLLTQPFSQALTDSLSGALVTGGIIFLIGVIGSRLFRKEAMGFGDVKIGAAVGTHLGLSWTILLYFLLSSFIGLGMGFALNIFRWCSSQRGLTVKEFLQLFRGEMPFGPAMAGAAMVLLLHPSGVADFVAQFYSFQ